jgi:hypothetical protein
MIFSYGERKEEVNKLFSWLRENSQNSCGTFMEVKKMKTILVLVFSLFIAGNVWAQCTGNECDATIGASITLKEALTLDCSTNPSIEFPAANYYDYDMGSTFNSVTSASCDITGDDGATVDVTVGAANQADLSNMASTVVLDLDYDSTVLLSASAGSFDIAGSVTIPMGQHLADGAYSNNAIPVHIAYQ